LWGLHPSGGPSHSSEVRPHIWGGLVGPRVSLIPLAPGPFWFSAQVARPPLLLRQPLPDLGGPPFLSAPSTQGGGTCMHWEWAASSAMGATAPSATRFVRPRLPPPVGASDRPAILSGAPPPQLNQTRTPGAWLGLPTDAGVVTRGRSGQTQSKASRAWPWTQPPVPCTREAA